MFMKGGEGLNCLKTILPRRMDDDFLGYVYDRAPLSNRVRL